MADKFSNEDIKEIVSKLEWKPHKSTYIILIVIILMIISLLCIMIYLILNQKTLNCDVKKLKEELNKKIKDITNMQDNIASTFANKTNLLEESLLDNSNEIRYLASTSGRRMKNLNLLQKGGYEQPIFANEKEDPLLYSASYGN